MHNDPAARNDAPHGSSAPPPSSFGSYPVYALRFWHGMTASTWFGLLMRNRLKLSPKRLPRALEITLYAAINSALAALQQLIYGRAIAATSIDQPPIFIIGHWRSGTTFLHELLALDQRFTAPTTYECFAPNHFLLSSALLTKLKFLLPATRPMDAMTTGWEHPQEDEFGLLNMGAGSFYETFAFPNDRPVRATFIDLAELPETRRAVWIDGFVRFLKQTTLRSQREEVRRHGVGARARRLVLKSPTHTARIEMLSKLFPGARFVHMVRDPYELLPSTERLWTSMCRVQSCQLPDWSAAGDRPSLQDFVFDTLDRLYRDYHRQRANLPSGSFCEVRYEDLARDPMAQVRRIYDELGLDGFAEVEPELARHLCTLGDYRASREASNPDQKLAVARRWHAYFSDFGYQP